MMWRKKEPKVWDAIITWLLKAHNFYEGWVEGGGGISGGAPGRRRARTEEEVGDADGEDEKIIGETVDDISSQLDEVLDEEEEEEDRGEDGGGGGFFDYNRNDDEDDGDGGDDDEDDIDSDGVIDGIAQCLMQ